MATWKEWQKLFWHGRTKSVYAVIFITVFYVAATIVFRADLPQFLLSLAAMIMAYGVFTDLVAHLFSDITAKQETLRQFFRKFIKFRTHDVYGLIMLIVITAYINVALWYKIALFGCAAFILYDITNKGFYH